MQLLRLTLIANTEAISIGNQKARKVRALINELSKSCDITVKEVCIGFPGFEKEIEVTINGKKESDLPAT